MAAEFPDDLDWSKAVRIRSGIERRAAAEILSEKAPDILAVAQELAGTFGRLAEVQVLGVDGLADHVRAASNAAAAVEIEKLKGILS